MVHEWAKLRWGVYEEHGYPGDSKFPMFYLKSTWTVNGPENVVMVNLCLNEELVGYEQVGMSVINGTILHDFNLVVPSSCSNGAL